MLDGRFIAYIPVPTRWPHIVLNYVGPNDGQGIRGYVNAQEVTNGTTKHPRSYPAGDGKIVVGRWYTDRDLDQLYSSIQIDELIFFNKALSTMDIKLLYNVI